MLTSAQKARWVATPFEGVDKVLNQKRGVMKAQYDFSVLGGAVGAISLVDEYGSPAILPNKAIITQVYIDTVTTLTSGGAATVAIGANTASDLLAATAIASYTGVIAGIPVGTAASMVKLTAQRQVAITVATAALTAGKLNVFVEFVLSD